MTVCEYLSFSTMLSATIWAGFVIGCDERPPSSAEKERQLVEQQNDQYAKAQPPPMFDYSLERDLVIQLYHLRNDKGVRTHSVWTSDTGVIKYDCPSMGYGIPYDTSLTNPLKAEKVRYYNGSHTRGVVVVGQQEPNGVYASTNTSATWVMCVGAGGQLFPHYVESTVDVYPGTMRVDYKANRVYPVGTPQATVSLTR